MVHDSLIRRGSLDGIRIYTTTWHYAPPPCSRPISHDFFIRQGSLMRCGFLLCRYLILCRRDVIYVISWYDKDNVLPSYGARVPIMSLVRCAVERPKVLINPLLPHLLRAWDWPQKADHDMHFFIDPSRWKSRSLRRSKERRTTTENALTQVVWDQLDMLLITFGLHIVKYTQETERVRS